jgi:lysozyme
MKLNKAGADLIKSFEGLRLESYRCSANKETIGYGSTFYEDGSPVKMGDKITKERADSLFEKVSDSFAAKVKGLIKSDINENQFSALVSFSFNVGIGNLKSSTLLKKVNANPMDASIRNEFLKWNRAAGKVLAGLTRRREAEANLYFKTP